MNKFAVLSLTTILLAGGSVAAVAGSPAADDGSVGSTAAADVEPALQQQDNGTLGVRVERSGDTLTVTLTSTGQNVAGYQANLTFDPDVVQFRSASGVGFADPVTNADQTAGWVFLTQSAADGTDNPTLVRVTFEIVGDGDPGIGFDRSNTLLNDADAENVDPDYETDAVAGLSVTTTSPTVTASPTVTSSSTASSSASDTPVPTPTPTASATADATAATGTTAATTAGGATDGPGGTDESDGGLLSNTFLLGIGAGVGIVLLLGIGLVAGMRLGD